MVTDPTKPAPSDLNPAAGALLAEAERVQHAIDGTEPAAADPDPGSQAAPAALPLDREIAGLAATIGAVLAQFFPSVKPVLTEEKCAEIGAAVAPVLVKYGIERYFAGFAWRTELQALLTVGPVVIAVRAAIVHDLAAMRAAQSPAGLAGAAEISPAPSPAAPMLRPVPG